MRKRRWTVCEFQSLVHYGFSSPAVPNRSGTGKCLNDAACAFWGVLSEGDWSSSSVVTNSGSAWNVRMNFGCVDHFTKNDLSPWFVWLVKGGQ